MVVVTTELIENLYSSCLTRSSLSSDESYSGCSTCIKLDVQQDAPKVKSPRCHTWFTTLIVWRDFLVNVNYSTQHINHLHTHIYIGTRLNILGFRHEKEILNMYLNIPIQQQQQQPPQQQQQHWTTTATAAAETTQNKYDNVSLIGIRLNEELAVTARAKRSYPSAGFWCPSEAEQSRLVSDTTKSLKWLHVLQSRLVFDKTKI